MSRRKHCSESLFASDDNHYQSIVTRQQLNCSLPIETTYYGSVTVTFKPICFHCDGTSGSELLNDNFTRDLKRKYAKVRPICRMCRAAGKEPSTCGVNKWKTKSVNTYSHLNFNIFCDKRKQFSSHYFRYFQTLS